MTWRPAGLGLWIAFPSMLKLAWPALAERCRALGASWVAVRTTDPMLAGAQLEAAVRAFHAVGVAFVGWRYTYPTAEDVSKNVAHLARVQNAGADGFVINAEIEFTGKRAEATRLGEALRAALPSWYIAHAPLGWIDYHPTWPYEEFLAWCDDVHPQLYWSELKHGKYTEEFRAQIDRWMTGHRHGGADLQGVLAGGKRICPIGVTYGRGDVATKAQPPGPFVLDDLRRFLEDDVQLAPCVSLYSLEVATPQTLEYLRSEWSFTP